MRILLISNNLPYPPNSGFPLRVYNLLYRIAGEHDVWLAAFTTGQEDPADIEHLRDICREVVTVPISRQAALTNPLQVARYFFKGIPPTLIAYESKQFVDKILDMISRVDFDVIQIEDSHMSFYLDYLPEAVRAKTFLTFHDVNFIKHEKMSQVEPRRARKLRTWLHSRMMRDWEPFQAQRFTHCITMSQSDKDLLLASNPGLKITVLPNGVDTQRYAPLPFPETTNRLIFVGNMAYRPNIDAVTNFCRKIYPIIKGHYPKIEFWIVGKDPTSEVTRFVGNGVHVTGRVDDLLPYYKDSIICVVPLRAGGGTRLKILEAMALGRPVVTTAIGCEGLDVRNGEHLFIADTPGLFAEHILNLLKNKRQWVEITRRARELVVERYDWDLIAQKHIQLYDTTCNRNLRTIA
ncbi:MAG: glycosyltransferase [Anaerolineales bacterium]|nr:glycosyltransferase [Anaerolineales bacterium]